MAIPLNFDDPQNVSHGISTWPQIAHYERFWSFSFLLAHHLPQNLKKKEFKGKKENNE